MSKDDYSDNARYAKYLELYERGNMAWWREGRKYSGMPAPVASMEAATILAKDKAKTARQNKAAGEIAAAKRRNKAFLSSVGLE